jgi:CheY-like chemotaxis protein
MSVLVFGQPPVNAAARPASAPNRGTRVLIADDLLLDRRMAGRILERLGGWDLTFACNGVEALAAMERELPDIVLTDLQMPQMDGLALVEQIREKHPEIPVVLMTRSGSEEIAVRALQSGAASYVPKRNLATDLGPTLQQVLTASRIDRQRYSGLLGCLSQRDSRFILENDPAVVTPLVVLLQEEMLAMGLCDATGATRAGIALGEALLNSMYYGNLEMPLGDRREGDDSFRQLAERRRQQPPFQSRKLRVVANVTRAEGFYVIFNEGPGFDPSALSAPADPRSMEEATSRRTLLMQTHMDQVSYSRTGCQVTLVKRRKKRERQS